MFPMPGWATDLVRNSHVQYGYIKARLNGAFLQLEDNGGLVYLDRTILPSVDGVVTIDGATPGARRTLTAAFAPQAGLFDLISQAGVELLAYSVLKAPNGDTVTIPQGVFPLDYIRVGYAANGDIKVSNVADRWSRVVNAEFLVPRASASGQLIRQQLATLLLEAMPAGSTITDLGTSMATVPAQTWDEDRAKAITELAEAASLDVFIDRYGQPVIRDAPRLSSSAVWLVDASASGVLIDADREKDRRDSKNLVVVTAPKNDGTALFDPVFVWDDDPLSPTYAGPDPVNAPQLAGPFGVRPTRLSSPLIATTDMARVAGRTKLDAVRGLASQLSLTTVPHPGLEDGDVIAVQLPRERYDLLRPVSYQLIDTVTIPLSPSKGTAQSIATRSTRADSVSG